MHRRHSRLAATLASAALAVGTTTLAGGAPAAAAPPPDSPLALMAPEKVVTSAYGGRVYTDFGLRLVAPDVPFELWSSRPSYDDQIRSEWRYPGGSVELEEGTMQDFSGLAKFIRIKVQHASDGTVALNRKFGSCLNGQSQRVHPGAPATSPYPWSCPWNPYTVGSVMGIEAGHAARMMDEFGRPIRLDQGRYDVTATIAPAYANAFGIAAADARVETRLVVKRGGGFRQQRPQPSSGTAEPAAHEPSKASAGALAGPTPDLRSLPAFNIGLNADGTALRFAATVWNAGDSPLVVDGFRHGHEGHMDAYQYFYDADGNQTGYEQVGEMHWHAENHNHWHFEDFARYRLLNEDMSKAVKSTKQSFCLANTDAVDYTVPDADWHPENTDLDSDCGGRDALSVRQVLSAGSGDTYLQYRYGQAFRIKNVPNGIYYVSVEANPMANLAESDTENNDEVRRIQIGGKGANRWVKADPVGIVNESLPGWLRGR